MRGISSFGGDAKRLRDGDDPKPPSKRRREEIDLPIGSHPPVSFNLLLKDLDVHGYYIPLSLFTTESLDYINKNSSSITTTKLNAPSSDKQICVLDSAHFEVNVLAECDMDRAQWTEAAQNYIKFMSLIGTLEDVAHWTAHFGFLVSYSGFFAYLMGSTQREKVFIFPYLSGPAIYLVVLLKLLMLFHIFRLLTLCNISNLTF
jgi:hypothetical protein